MPIHCGDKIKTKKKRHRKENEFIDQSLSAAPENKPSFQVLEVIFFRLE